MKNQQPVALAVGKGQMRNERGLLFLLLSENTGKEKRVSGTK